MKRLVSLLVLLAQFALAGFAQHSFVAGEGSFLLDGKPHVVAAAEIHYPRIPREYWDHRIKMCKALGMNAVCIYIFWNIHEQREGEFDWTGNNDVAAFCRLVQANGMHVIVRPGPYVCAEWEMGGLPWWLLKKKDIRLRERDPYFMERVKIFEREVGRQLAPLTIDKGGPIIMVQVENEYGSYGEDKPYVSEIRDCLREVWGKDITLFQCDWASNFEKNGLDDLVWTMNFGTGSDIDAQFRRLKELRPQSPLMCSEFWSGWFDKWGARHETRPAADMVAGMDEMLGKGISFSLYMTHGGTSFGHWAGANSPGFAPDVTSYDYDAPINEYGHVTPKYHELRAMMRKYSATKLPKIPAPPAPLITLPEMELREFSSILNGEDVKAGSGVKTDSPSPLTFEEMDMGWGCMFYTTSLPEIVVPSVLNGEFHDYAQVFVNGRFVGAVDRVKNEKSVTLPPVRKGDELQILVEGMGRINFGRAIKDFKGIVGDVAIRATVDHTETIWTPRRWTQTALPDTYERAVQSLARQGGGTVMGARGYYRGTFNLRKTGDTFLNMERWGKGQVWVNGHAIGRFWSVGPQQTLYVPGCWLRKGENEIIVLDVAGPQEAVVWGQDRPELDKLQITKTGRHNNIGDKPDLNSATPVASGSMESGGGWRTIPFGKSARGRYLAIECVSTHKSGDFVAVAEIYARDASGKRLDREPWTTKYADSEEMEGNHTGDKVFDLQESTFWQTERGSDTPHLLVIDLGDTQTLTAVELLPRADQNTPGSVKEYKVYLYE